MARSTNPEARRLAADAAREANWKRFGPYLAARQWGTVREDYSEDGDCWSYFTHEDARSRAYRWGEDGLLGWTDRQCRICFSIALWNGRDPFLKERLFGLVHHEGNHGEDVKEEYYFLESTPTHSWCKALYKYPQDAFPYEDLRATNRRRTKGEPEYELADTGVYSDDRYFDIEVCYAKAGPDDTLVRIVATNRGRERAMLHLLPTVWFRNTWSWGCREEGCDARPRLKREGERRIRLDEPTLGRYELSLDEAPGARLALLFTENETNARKLHQAENAAPFVKDAFHEHVVEGRADVVNPAEHGTKAAFHLVVGLEGGESRELRLRLRPTEDAPRARFGPGFRRAFAARKQEHDAYYDALEHAPLAPEERLVARQAYAGLLWSKQFYHYAVDAWLQGDEAQPRPPEARKTGRNHEWRHFHARDVLSMPDTWEYPWFAAWDSAFHMVAMARVDPQFAKDQLLLFLREWYMAPNGALPAYEFQFADVNPPVHAWACWRVYKSTAARGKRDRKFLARAFHKLLLNFTWWVNRKDPDGRNIFSGGFLGLDNIGIFDRSRPLPGGGQLMQADGTAWMAFFCLNMLGMAVELAQEDDAYEDVASKFFEHFVGICDAMNKLGGKGLWDEHDGYYHDVMLLDGRPVPLRVRSMVGLVPLIACAVVDEASVARLPRMRKRIEWFLANRRDLAEGISYFERDPATGRGLLAIPSRQRLLRVLERVFDESELLSPHGVRSLSKAHEKAPFSLRIAGEDFRAEYEPAETKHRIFGGNSNWRGPVWFPLNYLLAESLRRYHHHYGPSATVEIGKGSGRRVDLREASYEIERRLASLFLPGPDGRRPCHGDDQRYARSPGWKDLVLFHEYFHGDTGKGLGASHQTGWTALAARCLENLAMERARAGRAGKARGGRS